MIDSELKEIHALVGEASSLWNQAEELWYLIFTGLMAGTDRDVTDAIFKMFKTGAMQRQLITTVAKVSLAFDVQKLRAKDPEHQARRRLLKRVGQLHACTNDLAGKRNAITHAIYEIWDIARPPFISGLPLSKLSEAHASDNKTYLKYLIQDITILVIDLADLRDDFIERTNPGHRNMLLGIAQRGGYQTREVQRKTLRAELREAVKMRIALPPLPSVE